MFSNVFHFCFSRSWTSVQDLFFFSLYSSSLGFHLTIILFFNKSLTEVNNYSLSFHISLLFKNINIMHYIIIIQVVSHYNSIHAKEENKRFFITINLIIVNSQITIFWIKNNSSKNPLTTTSSRNRVIDESKMTHLSSLVKEESSKRKFKQQKT